MHALGIVRSQLPKLLLLRSRRHNASSSRAFASSSSPPSDDQSRGGLPRFYSRSLPSSKGDAIYVEDDEFWHMTKVLRLGVNDRLELFNGAGGIIQGCIQKLDRNGLEFLALEDPQTIAPKRIQWHVFAAFGTLKGGRADWLVEKCTELGATSITPLLTSRSPTVAENRVERLQRVSLAAVKQCQRLHEMMLNPPLQVIDLVPKPDFVRLGLLLSFNSKDMYMKLKIHQSRHAFLAAAGGTPLISTMRSSKVEGGLLIIGPEGDFTEEEVSMITGAGAALVGLGPCRLRVETATVALLAALMLWSESQDVTLLHS